VPEIKRAQTYGSFRQPPTASPAEARARQWTKMREVEAVLRRVGIFDLDERARALGLPRTTTWKILTGNSDPSAATINRILCAPRLPLPVRIKILEYVQERVSGVYGHSKSQSRRFSIRVGWARTHVDAGTNSSQSHSKGDQPIREIWTPRTAINVPAVPDPRLSTPQAAPAHKAARAGQQ